MLMEEMQRFKIKNNRNAQAVDQTLRTLKPGEHRLVKDDAGAYLEVGGCFVVESTAARFCVFAGKNQGYFEVAE